MRKQVGSASRSPGRQHKASCERPYRGPTLRALEIVATRGADVLGVRHLLEGGACWVGPAQSTIANIPMTDYGGGASMVAEVVDGTCKLHVPPRARARTHGKDGLGRLLVGPVDFDITEGDRAVVVLGPVQIRARVVNIQTSGKAETYRRRDALKWLVAMAALYFVVLGICALVVPEKPKTLERGALQRAVSATLDRAAEKARKRASTTP
jgi:hypothetical protein